jgi:hypothetical protein
MFVKKKTTVKILWSMTSRTWLHHRYRPARQLSGDYPNGQEAVGAGGGEKPDLILLDEHARDEL